MQQLAQATQQNTHIKNVLQNLTSQVTNLQNKLNNAPQNTQQHPGYQYQAYPAFTPVPAPYQQPPPDNNFKKFTHHSTAVPPLTLMTQEISNSVA